MNALAHLDILEAAQDFEAAAPRLLTGEQEQIRALYSRLTTKVMARARWAAYRMTEQAQTEIVSQIAQVLSDAHQSVFSPDDVSAIIDEPKRRPTVLPHIAANRYAQSTRL